MAGRRTNASNSWVVLYPDKHFLTIAFISYLFTWKVDFDKVKNGWLALLTDRDLKVENWLGKTGALAAHSFFTTHLA